MVFVSEIRSIEAGIVDHVAAAFKRALQHWAQHRLFRQTVNELSSLSGRELADLGIHHSMIKSIAMDAAYGK